MNISNCKTTSSKQEDKQFEAFIEKQKRQLKIFLEKNKELNELLGRKDKEIAELKSQLNSEVLKNKELFDKVLDALQKMEEDYKEYQKLEKKGFFTPSYIPEAVADVLRLENFRAIVRFAEKEGFLKDCQKMIRVPRIRNAKYKYQTTVLFSPYGIIELARAIRKNRRDFFGSLKVATPDEIEELKEQFFKDVFPKKKAFAPSKKSNPD